MDFRRLDSSAASAYRAVLGTFDGMHIGHRTLFAHACRHGDGLPVLAVVIERGGARLTARDRQIALFREAGACAAAFFDLEEIRELTPTEFVAYLRRHLQVRACVCGYNFTFGRARSGNADTLRTLIDTEVVEPVMIDGAAVSSSRIRDLIRNGDPAGASRLIGKPYSIAGTVEHGKELGRTIGFPTANILLPADAVEPAHGVYAARVTVGARTFPAVTDVGTRPTVNGTGVLVESHLLDFDGDLYGAQIEVALIDFLRPETRFPDIAALTTAIRADANRARALLTEH